LSELALGVMPEMPACPSPNGGRNILIVSPFKGSAPRIVGQNKANFVAMLYTTALFLEHLGFQVAAQQLSKSVDQAICAGKCYL
ncbi:hypothetical protein O7W_01320, partial [Bartonella quintana JK 56]